MALTLKQRNQIHDALVAGGVGPGDFVLTLAEPAAGIPRASAPRSPGGFGEASAVKRQEDLVELAEKLRGVPVHKDWRQIAAIRHPASESEALISVLERPDILTYHFQSTVTDGPSDWSIRISWDQVLEHVTSWADEVRYVMEEADRWAELQRSSGLLALDQGDMSNTPFTATEQDEITKRLDEIQAYLREQFELTAGQISAIESKLDELVDASRHVRRKDWIMMLNGAALTLIVGDLIPAHIVQGIVTTVITGLGHLFGLGGVPPVLPPQA